MRQQKINYQKELEKTGRYVAIPGDKTHAMIFIKDGENAEKKITAFLEKINKRPLRWN